MVWKNLLFISVKDLFARKGRLLLTMVGITVGVACLLFLLSLTSAIKKKVITEVLGTIPETELNVMPKPIDTGAIRMKPAGLTLDDEKVEEIRKSVPGIREIYGVKSLGLPAQVEVKFKSKILKAVVPEGFFGTECGVSGLPARLVASGLERLEDRERFLREYVFTKEKLPVPIVISTELVEMYNHHFTEAAGIPQVNPNWIKEQDFELTIGESPLVTTAQTIGPLPCKLVGISRRAPISSVTVPPEYIDYWRKLYFNEERKRPYQKVVIFANSVNLVGRMEARLEKMGFHVVSNRETISKINTASVVINALVILVSLIILAISSASIVNILTMSVYEEATDIAILRSVGARKAHVRGIYLLKAGFIGFIGALLGLLTGFAAIQIADHLAQTYLDHLAKEYLQVFQWRPDTFFLPSVSLVAACFLVGLAFSLIAGTIPANIAASLNPSKVLREG